MQIKEMFPNGKYCTLRAIFSSRSLDKQKGRNIKYGKMSKTILK